MKLARLVILGLTTAACAGQSTRSGPATPPDPARHRAALATVVVSNSTLESLAIAYRSATPPVREVVIGRVAGGKKLPMAPVPAGEPIVLVARRTDGTELSLAPRSFDVDFEWTWEIPHNATFSKPAPR
jgi:hypothetical protein